MPTSSGAALFHSACQQLGPGYLIREEDKVLLFVNDFVREALGFDPVGQTCHKVFLGSDTPCSFCPERQCKGKQETWECFVPAHNRLYSVRHLFLEEDGVPLRACRADDASEIMGLSRSAMDYLSLTKMLSEMQARLIGNQFKALEIIADSLRRQFKVAQVSVLWRDDQGTHLLTDGAEGSALRVVTGTEPEVAPLLEQPADRLTVDGVEYEFRLHGAADPTFWMENRQAVLDIARLYLENARFREQIEWENHHDRSTRLYNRAHFMALSRTRYAALPQVGVLFFDIDNLKRINDTHGHSMGDRLIKKAGEVLLSVESEHAHPYRMGGDEFLLVLEGADRAQVQAVLQQMMEGLGTSNELIPMPQLSISAGWAAGVAPFDLEALVTAADEMMYETKRAKKAART